MPAERELLHAERMIKCDRVLLAHLTPERLGPKHCTLDPSTLSPNPGPWTRGSTYITYLSYRMCRARTVQY